MPRVAVMCSSMHRSCTRLLSQLIWLGHKRYSQPTAFYSFLSSASVFTKLTKIRMASQSTAPPLNPAVQKLSWLLGTWESDKAEGFYPTIKPFHYNETLEFTHIGQPNINFRFRSWDPEGKPRHIENGFLRVQEGTNNVAYVAAHNIGITEVEEGQVTGSELSLESTAVHNMSFGSEPRTTKISRVFKLVDDSTLQQAVSMATSKTPELTPHLTVHYKKAN